MINLQEFAYDFLTLYGITLGFSVSILILYALLGRN